MRKILAPKKFLLKLDGTKHQLEMASAALVSAGFKFYMGQIRTDVWWLHNCSEDHADKMIYRVYGDTMGSSATPRIHYNKLISACYEWPQFKPEEPKMDAKTIEAIHKSINHWDLICQGVSSGIGPGNCDLCKKFGEGAGGLGFMCGPDCPVAQQTEHGNGCKNTSYNEYNMKSRSGQCCEKSAEAAEAMLETLVGLLPELGERIKLKCNSEQAKYEAYLPDDPDDKFYIFNGAHYVDTGITTDGRNRPAKAAEVWRKVFERQNGGKRSMGDFKEWSPEDMTECPTCGQEVKRKEPELIQGYTAEQWQEIIDGGYLVECRDFTEEPWCPKTLKMVKDQDSDRFIVLSCDTETREMKYHFCRPAQIKGVMRPIFVEPVDSSSFCHFFKKELVGVDFWIDGIPWKNKMVNTEIKKATKYIEV